MKRGVSILTGLAVLAMVAIPLHAAEKAKAKGGKKQAQAKRKKEDPKRVAFAADLNAVAQKLALTDPQKGKLTELKEARDKALSKYVEPLKDEQRKAKEQVEAAYDQRMFAVLTPEQRTQWNEPILVEEVMSEFSIVLPTAEQQERIQALCKTQAARIPVPLDAGKYAEFIREVEGMVYRNILTDQQREEYAKFAATKKRDEGQKDPKHRGGKGHGGKGHGGGGGGGGGQSAGDVIRKSSGAAAAKGGGGGGKR